jgi:short-subunit dehydrogenase
MRFSSWKALVALALARLALDVLRAARWAARLLALSRGGADLLSRYAGGNRAWAVVTRGAKGVGRGLSRMLAKRGFSVLMLGRDQAELAAQSGAVAREFGVESAWVATDLSSAFLDDASARALLREIEAAVRGKDIAVLACIAGDSDLARHLTDKPLSRNRALLHLNCLGTLGSIQLLMPRLVQRPCRSAIITCGALTAVQGGTPGSATSSANKSYIRALSNAISREYEGQVDVICAHPLAVESNILKASKNVRVAISADNFAEGRLCGGRAVALGARHARSRDVRHDPARALGAAFARAPHGPGQCRALRRNPGPPGQPGAHPRQAQARRPLTDEHKSILAVIVL